jgi:hypothetical protein
MLNKSHKIQFDLAQERVRELDKLAEVGQVGTRKDLFNNALTLLEWAMGECARGRKIASVSQDGKSYSELQMPILMNASRQAA